MDIGTNQLDAGGQLDQFLIQFAMSDLGGSAAVPLLHSKGFRLANKPAQRTACETVEGHAPTAEKISSER
jgi:hypothetical protein